MKNRNQCILYIHHTLNFRKPFNNFSVQHWIDCFECAHKVAEYREDTGKVFFRYVTLKNSLPLCGSIAVNFYACESRSVGDFFIKNILVSIEKHCGSVSSHLVRLCALISVNTHNLSAALKLQNRGICGAYRGISVIWILLQHIWVIYFYHLRFSKKNITKRLRNYH